MWGFNADLLLEVGRRVTWKVSSPSPAPPFTLCLLSAMLRAVVLLHALCHAILPGSLLTMETK